MKNNLGIADKTIRITIALFFLGTAFDKIFSSTMTALFLVVATVLIVTSFVGNCPFYKFLGISTKRNLNDKAKIHERNQGPLKTYLKNKR